MPCAAKTLSEETVTLGSLRFALGGTLVGGLYLSMFCAIARVDRMRCAMMGLPQYAPRSPSAVVEHMSIESSRGMNKHTVSRRSAYSRQFLSVVFIWGDCVMVLTTLLDSCVSTMVIRQVFS
jgi:hypothetical protein